jgi:hypothetical protein
MKALISPKELFTFTWISSWTQEGTEWVPVYSEILNCQRVAEVEPNDKVFTVASPLHWVDCPANCKADVWYFKNGQVFIKPTDVPRPA